MVTLLRVQQLLETSEEKERRLATDYQRAEAKLAKVLPILIAKACALAGKPVRVILDPNERTASTDCIASFQIAPWFFLEGLDRVGYGTTIHEVGHIRWSGQMVQILNDPDAFIGGDTQRHIMNIMMDRKDDMLTADFAPGYAEDLLDRLAYICTMGTREHHLTTLEKYQAGRSVSPIHNKINRREPQFQPDQAELAGRIDLTRHWKAANPYEDFFYAAKWHKYPRFPVVKRIMNKILTAKRLLSGTPEELLAMSEEIHGLLDEATRELAPPKEQSQQAIKAETDFGQLTKIINQIEQGGQTGPEINNIIRQLLVGQVATVRRTEMKRLVSKLRQKQEGHIWPRPLSTGLTNDVPTKKIASASCFAARYEAIKTTIEPLVSALVHRLRQFDNPIEFTLYEQDDGELDLGAVANIAADLGHYYQETVEERNIDADIHLCLDISGSMNGAKLDQAKAIGVLFSEAILAMHPVADGHIWAYNSSSLYDYGPVSRESGFTYAEGMDGNSDTHILVLAGRQLQKSKRRHKVIIMLCDDGPDSIPDVQRLSRALIASGIIVIHLFIGVHGTNQNFPYELLFTDFDECINDFGNVLGAIFYNLH